MANHENWVSEYENSKLEVVRAVLEIKPEDHEKLKSEVDLIRAIAQKERALVEAAREIDALDPYNRHLGVLAHATRFYDPSWSEKGKYLLLAPDNTSFPTFEANFLTDHPELTATVLGVHPISIDTTMVEATTVDADYRTRGKTAVGFIFDYTLRLQDVDIRILTAPNGLDAHDVHDTLSDSLDKEFDSLFPVATETEPV
jgi:hypothetical protein